MSRPTHRFDLTLPRYALTASPAWRLLWEADVPDELLAPAPLQFAPETEQVRQQTLEIVAERKRAGLLYGENGRLAAETLAELGRAGFWGLLIDSQYGGAGCSYREFVAVLTQLAGWESSLANLASVHGCLGAAGVLRNFGSDDQRARWLPTLAAGERLGVFGLTEPGAGSDLTAIRTKARRGDSEYRVTGEKRFITNLAPGRIMALVCRIDDEPAVLIVELPAADTPECQFIDYGIHAARRSGNRGVRFREFVVPERNRIVPARGNGLTIAYHGLNAGRMSLCAVVAGNLRRMLAGLIPWVKTRRTYGQPIGSRQLVERRLGRLASLIVGCDALAAWCATLLDGGYRGELEGTLAKIFAAEAQKEVTIDIALKTHGGRAFLHGHFIGDSLHDLLAPCIYEGESELLSLGFFRAITKERPEATAAVKNGPLAELAAEIWSAIDRHGEDLANQQCRMADLSARIQKQIAATVVERYLPQQNDPTTLAAGGCLVRALLREVNGDRASEADWHAEAAVGRAIIDEPWSELASVPVDRLW